MTLLIKKVHCLIQSPIMDMTESGFDLLSQKVPPMKEVMGNFSLFYWLANRFSRHPTVTATP
jgi:hypothetical protein